VRGCRAVPATAPRGTPGPRGRPGRQGGLSGGGSARGGVLPPARRRAGAAERLQDVRQLQCGASHVVDAVHPLSPGPPEVVVRGLRDRGAGDVLREARRLGVDHPQERGSGAGPHHAGDEPPRVQLPFQRLQLADASVADHLHTPSVGERRPRVRAPASDRLCESVRSLAARIATLTVAGQVTVRLPGYRIPPPQRKPAPPWRKILYPRRAVRLRSPSSSVESLGRSRDGGYAACARDYLSWPSIDRSPWLGRPPLPPRGTSRRDGRRQTPMSHPPRMGTDVARRMRARALARGHSPLEVAQEIHEEGGPLFGTSRIKAHRLAHGVALSDIVAQVKALYEVDGKPPPRLGETLLSAYESGYKRPGPEYLHYLCAVYRVEPDALDYQSPCICGRGHAVRPVAASVPQPREPERRPAQAPDTLVGA